MDHPDYNPESPNTPLSDDELQALDDLLAELPADGALNTEALDGYLTGLLAGPALARRLKGGDWLPLVWGGDGADGAPFTSNRQRKRVTVLVLRHLRHLDAVLSTNADQWQPVFSVAEADEREFVDASDWCAGFLQAVDLDREAWAPWLDTPQASQTLVPLMLLGATQDELSEAQTTQLEDPAVRDELSRTVPDAVTLLFGQQTDADADAA